MTFTYDFGDNWRHKVVLGGPVVFTQIKPGAQSLEFTQSAPSSFVCVESGHAQLGISGLRMKQRRPVTITA